MSDPQNPGTEEPPRLRELRCRRVDRRITPEEHSTCPYCFGRLSAVESGRYERFCDYRPGVDPIVFGFPDETDRERRG
jgi:hypothetical protein